MTDVHNPFIRSKNMRAIKNRNTLPELLIRKGLHARGFRFRLHRKDLPGNPDIVLPKFRAVIFINGCFWHGHRCHLSKAPKTRTEFWLSKISNNMSRDAISYDKLFSTGWRFAIIWECALKGRTRLDFDLLMNDLSNWLHDIEGKGIEVAGNHREL